MDNIIQLENVNKIYGRRVKNKVLSEVNISIEKGSFNSIIGASGSGKTTLLNIMGMLDKPTTGEVYIQGKSIKSIGRNSRASVRNKSIGFVFQFHYLLPEFNAIQNVLMPYRIKHFFCGRSAKRKAEELLELVGLSGCKKKKVYDLSGGQQQRIAIARALMNDPSIVLADEPTGNLDSTNAESIYKLFRQINDKFGTTFIIVTHDVSIANKTDRIIQIKDGQVRS
ncbi:MULTISPECIES: ABC transporter ATP-binding protein [Clostridium]|uniref:Lipoprotein-releasing system ATP-binding protein LolD n=1 Tax=Clostridium ragsdalei P11 TaxID=1353534 RepID=A0A1A6B0S7_9CLOT|nr:MULTISPECIES: ABC transporter ATP-binding protein [Clostridium]OBR95907.1 lipoprotein-releasing system ATP-binding protein LolD [Clostridium ragsdalei P11]QXE19812.1 lipoprotein ABC transporter ATP-binding protein LolD [Clostridium sp. 001]